MNTIQVDLGNRSYPITIGYGLIERTDLLLAQTVGHQVMIVTDETVADLYLPRLKAAFTGREVHELVLPAGEIQKNLAVFERILESLLTAGFNRDCTLVALGGGVIGDLVGFAAACYQRGVAFVQIPTTLLAQVDSSVGGKTAVNHPLGKNMIGVFHQPVAVLADLGTLTSLDDRQFSAGLAEVVKYGLLQDAEFFAWLERRSEALLSREPEAISHAVQRSCEIKAEIVHADERETGVRALLNLGHTFGHAIELGLGYGTWLHGEAVAAGMLLAADLSARHGWLASNDVERIGELLARFRLPALRPGRLSVERMLELMALDKKVTAGKTRLVLLHAIGNSLVTSEFDPELLHASLEQCVDAA